MTDGQWALLAPLLPAAGSTGGRGGRPEKWDRRLVLDAIFYLVRGGIAWRALPADFPPHQTVYTLFRRWTRARAWCRTFRITAALREAFSTITLVWADAGYTGRFVRDARKIWDLAVAIVKRPDQAKGFVLLHRRWVVERSVAWLTNRPRQLEHGELVRCPRRHPVAEAVLFGDVQVEQRAREAKHDPA